MIFIKSFVIFFGRPVFFYELLVNLLINEERQQFFQMKRVVIAQHIVQTVDVNRIFREIGLVIFDFDFVFLGGFDHIYKKPPISLKFSMNILLLFSQTSRFLTFIFVSLHNSSNFSLSMEICVKNDCTISNSLKSKPKILLTSLLL